ncbi:PREDICTED: LOW QUALITY PROTEIN: coiled-coil domain-containing protein 137 [Cyphomyrmex costatus]|uniref:LOW QUALITY PROTEIN: coiled-coil domain-containing protein 137 n=1 Tax=Cyphomyrmex costatus TaxID=456900 RepID=UPI0008523B75|nr:PREDICTED: LOW QUALITY PROTEIN: coiled-coil domain-containing protein 137 [Cyphomyrmex costatus]
MGRKIPGKRHRGIKDREKQHIKRLAELELCTNAAPKNINDQEIPKSLERIIKLKEAVKTSTGFLKRKKKKKNALICVGLQHRKPSHSKDGVIPVFQQRPGESGNQFMHRVSKDTHNFLKGVEFEKKYGVQIERDSNTGEIQGLTKCKNKKNAVEILGIKHKNINKKKKILESSTTLSKNESRKLKLLAKKEKKLERYDGFEGLQDKIDFGEVVSEPPRLKIKSDEINEDKKPKNLLLNSLLKGSKEDFFTSKEINQFGKRKYLPETERRKLEEQQVKLLQPTNN